MSYADYIPNALEDYSDDPLKDFISSFSIIPHSFGHQYDSPLHITFNDRVIGDFELIYVVGGTSIITVNNVRYDCGNGELVIIPPFTRHSILTTAEDPHNNYWLHFDIIPVSMQQEFIKALMTGNSYMTRLGLIPEIISLYERLEEELSNRKPGYYSHFCTLATQIVTEFLRIMINRHNTPVMARKNRAESDIVERAINYIQNNIFLEMNIGDIAKELHISKSYLFQCFSNILGMTPSRFIQTAKIKHVEKLLITTDFTISQISEKIGYSSPYYMSRVFKKFYGKSPKEYRKSFLKY